MKSEAEEILDLEISLLGDTTCSVCYAEFLDAEDLDIHIRQMHSPPANPKYCQICREYYTDLMDYAAHVRDAHLMDLRSCRFCTKVFMDSRKLKMHERKHLDADAYSCSQCNSMFRELTLLQFHERKNHDNDKDGCFLKCMPYLSAILNMKAVVLLQNAAKKSFRCYTCNFTSASLQMYKKHLEKEICQGHVCDRCSGLFKSRKYLIKHVKYTKKCLSIEEYSDEKTTKCKDCDRQIQSRAMKFHSKICSALKCIDCDKICSNIDELSAHQLKEHPLDMTLIRCKFCLKEFIGQSPLQKHVDRVHKPFFHLYKYKCVDCNVIFQHPQKLFAHYFTKHKELEPFNCKICNKTFRVRKGFSLHIKLNHKSVGFVEFDDKYHVFFTANKSEKPFVPECVVPPEMMEYEDTDKKTKPFSIRTRELLETDADATEAETEDEKKPLKRKQTPRQIKSKRPKMLKKEPVLIYSSDEEPLLEVRKRAMRKRSNKRCHWTWKKNLVAKAQFTCSICNKNCYTYQNHQNHMSLHKKGREVECVKCFKRFNSKNDLNKHMNKDHATSKLTETLKSLLAKKKHNAEANDPATPQTLPRPQRKPDKFKISMNKVKINKCEVSATITPVEKDLSVKNFLENFTPDVHDAALKEKVKIGSDISITPYVNPFYRESIIKLTKFKDEPMDQPISLKMPERFKQYDHYVKTKVSIKLVQQLEKKNDFILPNPQEHDYFESFQDHNDDKNDDIPEMAHEVSLEGTEELPIQLPTKIVIPKMPKGYSKLHIATLQTEAPYFKIIKVDSENLKEVKEEDVPPPPCDVIDLPGGTKLVTANPLAHLLGKTPLDKILEPVKKKNYKPVTKDFQGMLAQAMLKLEQPPPPRKRRAKPEKKPNNPNKTSDCPQTG